MPARAAIQIERSADQVWDVIGDFGDVGWIPGASAASVEGGVRTFRLGESLVRHRLVAFDDAARRYSYVLADDDDGPGQVAVSNEATIEVIATRPHTSTVVWTARTEERRRAAAGLSNFFQGILDHLKSDLEQLGNSNPHTP